MLMKIDDFKIDFRIANGLDEKAHGILKKDVNSLMSKFLNSFCAN